MKINHQFTVHAPIEQAWTLLTDVEAIAPCMPGAQLTGIRPAEAGTVGETYEGKVKVKMGPVVAEYKGTAVFIEKDDEKYRGVIDAKGRDSRGAGNASATITLQLQPDGEGTTVQIETDLKISGKIAQFGAGMIQEVSEKLLGQFVGCLEGKLAAPTEPEPVAVDTAAAAAAPTAGTAAALVVDEVTADAALATSVTPVGTEPAPAAATATTSPAEPVRRPFQAMAEPEALDLLDLAGGAAFKRLLPLAIAGAAVVAAVIFFLVRR
jgi:carbon monoxide dehydrogenase subunit G